MPIHDSTRVGPGRFHSFRLGWAVSLAETLNRVLPANGCFALLERPCGLDQPPDIVEMPDAIRYAAKADRIAIHREDESLVAAIEIASPGNKHSAMAAREFVGKAEQFLRRGVHLLILDLFPPTPRDPRGLPGLVWKRIAGKRYELPEDRPLSGASFRADLDEDEFEAFLEPLAVGLPLPDLPVFLSPETYVPCPLEATYQANWEALPKSLRAPLETSPNRQLLDRK